MNMIEKILARASGRAKVTPGDVVVANVDCLLLHDLSGYLTARVFEREVRRPMRYPERVVMVFDHHFSPPSEERAEILQENRRFAKKHGIHLFDCGSGNTHHVGVHHGFVRPGTVVVGSDSHTPVHGTLGCFATGLGNDSHAGTVMPFGKAWFRVPETIQIRLTGSHRPGVTPRDVTQWLIGEIGEGGAGSNQAINMGAMAADEAMISTHARNFPGRNGSPEAKMYLGSALTVAASAVTGAIADPRQMLI